MKKKEKDQAKLFSFKKATAIMIGICWLVPIAIIFIGMSYSYNKNMVIKAQELMKEEIKVHSMTMSIHISEVINITGDIFYERKLEQLWKKKDNYSDTEFHEEGKSIMKLKFGNDWRVATSFFYYLEESDMICPQTDWELVHYTEEKRAVFHEISGQDNAKPHIRVIDQQIYLIRNIYAISGYEKFATIVIVFDMDKLLNYMSTSNMYDLAFLFREDNVPVLYKENIENMEEKNEIIQMLEKNENLPKNQQFFILKSEDKKCMGIVYENEQEDFYLTSVLIMNPKDLLSELDTLSSLIGGLLLVIIPIIWFYYWYFHKNITVPVEKLVGAVQEITKGNMGKQVQIPDKIHSYQEFRYLFHSFNEMSSQIKYLFNYAYQEEIARRDAQILALQSQINPHFLNNTLEMMNWQARMAGDINVSKMIEALSTLLDHSMNRNNEKLISLSDELRSADAYFYIISMRFGQRLQVEKNIDENLLQVRVPKLILQPILENAVVHGVEFNRRGKIWINIYGREKRIIMEVLNTGENMTKEEEDRVNKILSGKLTVKKEAGSSMSIGIRNVNQRIQLIYGEGFGLTIKPNSDKITAAIIEIPREWEEIK